MGTFTRRPLIKFNNLTDTGLDRLSIGSTVTYSDSTDSAAFIEILSLDGVTSDTTLQDYLVLTDLYRFIAKDVIGAPDFRTLSDTPDSFEGMAGKTLFVSPDESSLYFDSVSLTLTGLQDTPNDLNDSAGKVLVVNTNETGYEFKTVGITNTISYYMPRNSKEGDVWFNKNDDLVYHYFEGSWISDNIKLTYDYEEFTLENNYFMSQPYSDIISPDREYKKVQITAFSDSDVFDLTINDIPATFSTPLDNNDYIKDVYNSKFNEFGFIVSTKGKLYATGINTNGQLGTGDNISKFNYIEILTDVDKIACGAEYTLVLKTDGTLLVSGLLDIEGYTNDYTFQEISNDILDIVSGYDFIYIKTDTAWYALGNNTDGQLDDTTTETRNNFYAISSGLYFSKIVAGYNFALGLFEGNVYGIGNGSLGNFGNSTNDSYITFTDLGYIATDIDAGYNHIAILDGTLKLAGVNTDGQLATGDNEDSNALIDSTLTPDYFNLGYGTSYIIINGAINSSGLNTNGQLGTGDTTSLNVFTDTTSEALIISAGFNFATSALGTPGLNTSLSTGSGANGALSSNATDDILTFTLTTLVLDDLKDYISISDPIYVDSTTLVFSTNNTDMEISIDAYTITEYFIEEGNVNIFEKTTNTPDTLEGSALASIRVNESEDGFEYGPYVPTIYNSISTPINANDGDIWFNSDTGIRYQMFDGIWKNEYQDLNVRPNLEYCAETITSLDSKFTITKKNYEKDYSKLKVRGKGIINNTYLKVNETIYQPLNISPISDNIKGLKLEPIYEDTYLIFDNGDLWVYGANTNGELGLGNNDVISELTFTGITGVKKVDVSYNASYILLENGSLLFAGSPSLNNINWGSDYYEFTSPNLNYNITDISIASDNLGGYAITEEGFLLNLSTNNLDELNTITNESIIEIYNTLNIKMAVTSTGSIWYDIGDGWELDTFLNSPFKIIEAYDKIFCLEDGYMVVFGNIPSYSSGGDTENPESPYRYEFDTSIIKDISSYNDSSAFITYDGRSYVSGSNEYNKLFSSNSDSIGWTELTEYENVTSIEIGQYYSEIVIDKKLYITDQDDSILLLEKIYDRPIDGILEYEFDYIPEVNYTYDIELINALEVYVDLYRTSKDIIIDRSTKEGSLLSDGTILMNPDYTPLYEKSIATKDIVPELFESTESPLDAKHGDIWHIPNTNQFFYNVNGNWLIAEGNVKTISNGHIPYMDLQYNVGALDSVPLIQTNIGTDFSKVDLEMTSTTDDFSGITLNDEIILPLEVSEFEEYPIRIAGGSDYVLVLTNLGNLYGKGSNSDGQLGLGDTDTREDFTFIIDGVKEVVAENRHGFIIKYDDTLWAVGDNGTHQLGIGDVGDQHSYVQAPVYNVKKVSTDYRNSAVLTHDGKVYVAGYNRYEIFGEITNSPWTFLLSTELEHLNIVDINVNYGCTSVLTDTGELWYSSNNLYNYAGLPDSNGKFVNSGIKNVVKLHDKSYAGIYYTKDDNVLYRTAFSNCPDAHYLPGTTTDIPGENKTYYSDIKEINTTANYEILTMVTNSGDLYLAGYGDAIPGADSNWSRPGFVASNVETANMIRYTTYISSNRKLYNTVAGEGQVVESDIVLSNTDGYIANFGIIDINARYMNITKPDGKDLNIRLKTYRYKQDGAIDNNITEGVLYSDGRVMMNSDYTPNMPKDIVTKDAIIEVNTTLPEYAKDGDIYYDEIQHKVFHYFNNEWVNNDENIEITNYPLLPIYSSSYIGNDFNYTTHITKTYDYIRLIAYSDENIFDSISINGDIASPEYVKNSEVEIISLAVGVGNIHVVLNTGKVYAIGDNHDYTVLISQSSSDYSSTWVELPLSNIKEVIGYRTKFFLSNNGELYVKGYDTYGLDGSTSDVEGDPQLVGVNVIFVETNVYNSAYVNDKYDIYMAGYNLEDSFTYIGNIGKINFTGACNNTTIFVTDNSLYYSGTFITGNVDRGELGRIYLPKLLPIRSVSAIDGGAIIVYENDEVYGIGYNTDAVFDNFTSSEWVRMDYDIYKFIGKPYYPYMNITYLDIKGQTFITGSNTYQAIIPDTDIEYVPTPLYVGEGIKFATHNETFAISDGKNVYMKGYQTENLIFDDSISENSVTEDFVEVQPLDLTPKGLYEALLVKELDESTHTIDISSTNNIILYDVNLYKRDVGIIRDKTFRDSNLLSNGIVSMDDDYMPINDKDIATKEIVPELIKSLTVPSVYKEGDLWFKEDTRQLYISIDNEWVSKEKIVTILDKGYHSEGVTLLDSTLPRIDKADGASDFVKAKLEVYSNINDFSDVQLNGVTITEEFVSDISIKSNKVKSKYNNTGVLLSTQKLRLTGSNANGQLGNGTTDNSLNFIEVNIDNVIDFDISETAIYLVTAEGKLYGAGSNSIIGLSSSTFIDLGLGDIYKVSSNEHILALTTGGTLYGAGLNDKGQLGDDSTVDVASFKVIAESVKTIHAGFSTTAYIDMDDNAYVTGLNTNGQLGDGTTNDSLVFINTATAVKDINIGITDCLYLNIDGTVYGAGLNDKGQLGNETNDPITTLTDLGLTSVEEISLIDDTSIVRHTDGTIQGTGENTNGQLGLDSIDNINVWTQIGTTTSITNNTISSGNNTSAYISDEYIIKVSGLNDVGQLSTGTTDNSLIYIDAIETGSEAKYKAYYGYIDVLATYLEITTTNALTGALIEGFSILQDISIITNIDYDFLTSDGIVDMKDGYTPINPLSIATKEYADNAAPDNMLTSDGNIDMDDGYTPNNLLSIATKEYVDNNIPSGVILSDGTIDMDDGYTPNNLLSIATKEYVDNNIPSGVILSDGTIDMDDGYTPNNLLSIATKEYVDTKPSVFEALTDVNVTYTDNAKKHLKLSDDETTIEFGGQVGLTTEIGVNGVYLECEFNEGIKVDGGAFSTNFSYRLDTDEGANGDYSFATGYGNKANGLYSAVFGAYSEALGDYSFAQGNHNIAEAEYSITLNGRYNTASGRYSLAIGSNTIASGFHAITSGYRSIASNSYDIAIGYENESSGEYSTTLNGRYNTASGKYSFVLGSHTKASGFHSIASGYQTTSSNTYSIGLGDRSESSGKYSTTLNGNYNIASGDYSFAQGSYINTSTLFKTAIGTYNEDKTESIYEIGYGTSSARKNIFDIDYNGRAHSYVAKEDIETDNDYVLVTKQYLNDLLGKLEDLVIKPEYAKVILVQESIDTFYVDFVLNANSLIFIDSIVQKGNYTIDGYKVVFNEDIVENQELILLTNNFNTLRGIYTLNSGDTLDLGFIKPVNILFIEGVLQTYNEYSVDDSGIITIDTDVTDSELIVIGAETYEITKGNTSTASKDADGNTIIECNYQPNKYSILFINSFRVDIETNGYIIGERTINIGIQDDNIDFLVIKN